MRFVAALALVAAAAAYLSGGAGVAQAAPRGPLASSEVCVRVVNAAAGAPDVNVWFNSRPNPTPPNFTFGSVSNYWPEAGGTQTISVSQAGQPKSASFFKTTVQTPGGAYYTLALLGDTSSSLSITVFKDDPSIANGSARVRVYHLSPDAELASVSVGGQAVISGIGYQQASTYLTVKPGNYTFDVAVQGGSKTVSLNTGLEANHVTSVFGVGKVNDTGADAFKFVEAVTAAMPANWPQTGFDPRGEGVLASRAQPQPVAVPDALTPAALLGAALVLLLGVARRSSRRPAPELRARAR